MAYDDYLIMTVRQLHNLYHFIFFLAQKNPKYSFNHPVFLKPTYYLTFTIIITIRSVHSFVDQYLQNLGQFYTSNAVTG